MLVVVAADQLSKHAVRQSIVPGEEREVLPGIQLVNTRNHGVAFGFLPGEPHRGHARDRRSRCSRCSSTSRSTPLAPLIWLPTGMLIGGALGNILDRLRDGSVTDFIKLPLGWPPFNLADTSITLGVLLLFFVIEAPREGLAVR